MEYHREFLARWYSFLTPARTIARADVRDRYVAKIGAAGRREVALLKDVTDLIIALAPESREALPKQLEAVGWACCRDGTRVLCIGPEGVELRLVDAGKAPPGIMEAGFSLQRSVTATTHRLGTAELRLEGEAARLRFR
jgi:hypothetical protein